MYKDYPVVSIVSDTYDLHNAIENIWGGSLREKVRNRKNRALPRPDSGDPVVTSSYTLSAMRTHFGGSPNSKGYWVLPNNVRVIQGDGVNLYSIFNILNTMRKNKMSAENIVFGMGGALLQGCTRDTYSFAMKLSAIRHRGRNYWTGVKKTVATDHKKKSLAGRFFVSDSLETFDLDNLPANLQESNNLLQPVWDGSEMLRDQTFDEIRKLARKV